jgi:hypothetical protein
VVVMGEVRCSIVGTVMSVESLWDGNDGGSEV